MKKSILAIAFVALTAVSCKTEKNKVTTGEEVKDVQKVENLANSFEVNIEESTMMWKGSKPTGSHNGNIAMEYGAFEVENGIIKAGEFVVNMNSIVCTDLEGQGKENLEKHLKAADFFDVEKFPAAKFEVASSELKGEKLHITGNLTIKDVTKSITIPAVVYKENGLMAFKSDTFSIDRTEFGIEYKSKKIFENLKDKFIDDLIEISFDVKAKS